MAPPAATSSPHSKLGHEFNRLIVDGKIVHPITGEIQKAGRKGLTDGPHGVSMHIINMSAHGKVRSISGVSPVSVEKVYLAIAKHVRDGIYKLISVNASAYSFVIVCDVQVSDEEFSMAWKNKFAEESEVSYFRT